jgi:hypothetical protein
VDSCPPRKRYSVERLGFGTPYVPDDAPSHYYSDIRFRLGARTIDEQCIAEDQSVRYISNGDAL